MSLILIPNILFGQNDTARVETDTLPESFLVLQKVYRDGETLPEMEIKEVTIKGLGKSPSRIQVLRYDRMVYNVRRVYPYAVVVRMKLDLVNADLEKIPDDKGRREYIRGVEKEVFRDYEDDMRGMTFTQGRILIKLIDRETQNSSYDLIRSYKGGISAAFWQGVARIFGTNLKDKYDPYGEDILIERIINDIEAGYF